MTRILELPNNYDNYIIFKNGYSTLGSVSYKYKTGNELSIDENVWANIQQFTYTTKRPDSTVFIVYRDPYERLISLYKDLMTGVNLHLDMKHLYKDGKDKIFDNFVEYFIKQKHYNYDGHTKQITNLFSNEELDSIDLIVDIKDLSKFINTELNMSFIKRNVSNTDIDVSGFNKYKNEIIEFYKPDYDWYNENKHKFWIPS